MKSIATMPKKNRFKPTPLERAAQSAETKKLDVAADGYSVGFYDYASSELRQSAMSGVGSVAAGVHQFARALQMFSTEVQARRSPTTVSAQVNSLEPVLPGGVVEDINRINKTRTFRAPSGATLRVNDFYDDLTWDERVGMARQLLQQQSPVLVGASIHEAVTFNSTIQGGASLLRGATGARVDSMWDIPTPTPDEYRKTRVMEPEKKIHPPIVRTYSRSVEGRVITDTLQGRAVTRQVLSGSAEFKHTKSRRFK